MSPPDPTPAAASAAVTAALAEARAGRVDGAIAALQALVAANPRNPDALHELGLLLAQRGRVEPAIAKLAAAAELAPREMRYQFNFAFLLQQCGQVRRAIAHFRQAAELKPDDPYPLHALAAALREVGELEAAAEALARLIAIAPADADAHNVLGLVLLDQGKLEPATAAFRSAMRLRPPNAQAHSNLLLALNYDETMTPRRLYDEHAAFGRLHAPSALPPHASHASEAPHASEASHALPQRTPAADGRLRIGYLSPDLRNHPVAHFLLPVLANHDRARFAVTCYSDTRVADGVTQQLRRLPERWRDVAGLGDAQLAGQIHDDQIDLLIDLAGHTAHNRMPLLARQRLAPVQATYLGYPNTTGLPTIDFRITDAIADPPGLSDDQHTERLVRLDAFFTSVRIPEAPEVGPLPAAAPASRGAVTFGVISNFAKVRPPAMRCWAEILHALPHGRLLIQAKAMDDAPTRSAFTAFFQARGIPADRIECRGWSTFPDFLRLLNERIDITLDTWPFGGHTTTCHALLMGVPVITLAGQSHRGRMGTSILTHLGLTALIADDEAGYIRLVLALAGDVQRLAALRASLRERLLGSRLFDQAGFTRQLEAAYERMVRGEG